MNTESECRTCGTRNKMRLNNEDENVDKCRQWLERCSMSDDTSTCSCDTSDSSSFLRSDECSSTCDDISYDSDGLALLDKVCVSDEYNFDNEELKSMINKAHNVYNNVTIKKSKKVHLGNVTYINGPVYITKTKNTINQLNTVNEIIIPDTEAFSRIRMVDRKNWLAQPSLTDYTHLEKPANYVVICHTATEDGLTQADNILLVRLIQQFHIESRNWGDIGYNFLIGSDGNTYSGRGWGVVGAHTLKYNRISVGISFVGCFMNKVPPKVALDQAKDLIEQGLKLGHIDPDYKIIGHNQCVPSESPGRMLVDIIKTWDRFDPTIDIHNPSPLL